MRMRHLLMPLAFAGAAVVVLGGCQSAPSHTATASRSAPGESSAASSFDVKMAAVSEADFAQRHQFYYYPNAQVYRDCDEDRWIWSKDSGLTWQSGPRLPMSIGLGQEIPFVVTLSVDDPTIEHQETAAAYPPDSAALTTAHPRSDSETP